MSEIQTEIEIRIGEAFKNLKIDCPDCEDVYGYDQYTCVVCWCEGGQGQINVSEKAEIIINK